MHQKPIWITPLDLNEVNQWMQNTLCEYLGIKFIEVGADYLTASMPVDHRTMQPMGMLHGGASCALAETVGSTAANYCVDQNQSICVGLDINSNHIHSVRSGIIKAVAKPFHLGRTTQVWEIKVYNEPNRLISISRLTIAVLQKN